MVKMFGNFFALFLCLYFGIDLFRQFTNRQRWDFVKTASYSALIAVITVAILSIIVILF
jgi:hypothetical protein